LAADAVAVMAENGGADGPAEKADKIGPERQQGGGESIRLGKEELAEHQTRGGAVEKKIVPLDGRADGGSDNRLAEFRFRKGVCRAPIRHAATPFPAGHLLRSQRRDQSRKAREVSFFSGSCRRPCYVSR